MSLTPSSSPYYTNFKEFDSKPQGLPPTFTENISFADPEGRKYSSFGDRRLVKIDLLDQEIETYESKEKRWTTVLRTVSYIFQAAIPVIGAFATVSCFYLPIWVPLGICLPLSFILYLVNQNVIAPRVAKREHEYQRLLDLKEKYRHHSFKAITPIDERNLKQQIDKRLISDFMMEKNFPQPHPPSIGWMKILQHVDLDLTPTVMEKVSDRCMGINAPRRALPQTFFQRFLGQEPQKIWEEIPIPGETPKDRILKLARLYACFSNHYLQLDKLYEEVEKLYGLCSVKDSPSWVTYIKKVSDVERKMQPHLRLLRDEKTTAVDYFQASRKVQQNRLFSDLLDLIEHTKKMQKEFREKINRYPTNRLETIKRELEEKGKEILGWEALKELGEWNLGHPQEKNVYINDLPKETSLLQKLKAWLDKDYLRRAETPATIFDRNYAIRTALEEAKGKYSELDESSDFNDFEIEVMKPLRNIIIHQGETSFIRSLYKAVKRMRLTPPPKPFKEEKLPTVDSPLYYRKIEQRWVNEMLNKIDKKMLGYHRFNAYAIAAPLKLFFVAEAILLFTAPAWTVGGLAALMLAGEGLSFYINYRIRQLHREKQAIKVYKLERNSPLIGPIPGKSSRLREVAVIQQKYTLDGVGITRARVKTVGEQILPQPKSLDEARKTIEKIAQEGSRIIATFQQNREIIEGSQNISFTKNVKEFEKAAEENRKKMPSVKLKSPSDITLSFYKLRDKKIVHRMKDEQWLDRLVEEKLLHNIWINDFEQNLKRIATLRYRRSLYLGLLGLLHVATEQKEHPRNSDEDIEKILERAKAIYAEIARKGSDEDNKERLRGLRTDLEILPVVRLQATIEQYEERCKSVEMVLNKLTPFYEEEQRILEIKKRRARAEELEGTINAVC